MALNYRSFGFQVLVGMVAGLLLGLVARQMGAGPDGDLNWLATALKTLGAIFVSLLKAVVPPLVFAAIVASIANLRALDNAARLAGQTLLWFAITSLIAVSIGIAIGLLLEPGAGLRGTALAVGKPDSYGGWLDFLKGLVPGNSLALSGSTKLENGAATTSLSFNILQLLVISIVVGLATLKVGDKAEPFLAFVRSLLAVVRAILGWIIRLTPIGSAALIGTAIATYGWSALAQLGVFTAAIYLGLALVLLVVYPTLLLANGLRPGPFFAKAWPAIQLGFVSRSSVGTLPVTETVTERMGVDKGYAAFAIPLASTTKMDGCASIYPALAADKQVGHAELAYQEQSAAKMEMGLLERLDPMSQDYLDKLEHIRGAVAHHVYSEEGTWFLELAKDVGPDEQAMITQRYKEEFERYAMAPA